VYDDERVRRHHAAGGTRGTPETATPVAPVAARLLQLQRQIGNQAVAQLMEDESPGSHVGQVVAGGGQPLDLDTRQEMESAIGGDFASVRVHTDDQATRSARELGAHAYTVGEDIVFAEGRYDPASADGRETLAHELTHVVQQRSGPVDGTDDGSGVKVSDPNDRFEQEAEHVAAQVAASAPTPDLGGGPPAAGGVAVQRDDDGG